MLKKKNKLEEEEICLKRYEIPLISFDQIKEEITT